MQMSSLRVGSREGIAPSRCSGLVLMRRCLHEAPAPRAAARLKQFCNPALHFLAPRPRAMQGAGHGKGAAGWNAATMGNDPSKGGRGKGGYRPAEPPAPVRAGGYCPVLGCTGRLVGTYGTLTCNRGPGCGFSQAQAQTFKEEHHDKAVPTMAPSLQQRMARAPEARQSGAPFRASKPAAPKRPASGSPVAQPPRKMPWVRQEPHGDAPPRGGKGGALTRAGLAQAEVAFWEGHVRRGSAEAQPKLVAAKEKLECIRREEFLSMTPLQQVENLKAKISKEEASLSADTDKFTHISHQIDALCDDHFRLGQQIQDKVNIIKNLQEQLRTTSLLAAPDQEEAHEVPRDPSMQDTIEFIKAHPDAKLDDFSPDEAREKVRAFLNDRDQPKGEGFTPLMGPAAPFAEKVTRINASQDAVQVALESLPAFGEDGLSGAPEGAASRPLSAPSGASAAKASEPAAGDGNGVPAAGGAACAPPQQQVTAGDKADEKPCG